MVDETSAFGKARSAPWIECTSLELYKLDIITIYHILYLPREANKELKDSARDASGGSRWASYPRATQSDWPILVS